MASVISPLRAIAMASASGRPLRVCYFGSYDREHFRNQALRDRQPERDNFDRQRKSPKCVHLLAGICNHDHAVACGGHDLFVQMRATAALDQVQLAIRFVGAVDIDLESAGGIKIEYRDT